MLVVDDSVSDEDVDVFLDELSVQLTAFFDDSAVISIPDEKISRGHYGKVSHQFQRQSSTVPCH